MELHNNQSPQRRVGARAAQPIPDQHIQGEMAKSRKAQEANLRSTIERVGESSRKTSAQLRRAAGDAGDRVELSKVAEQAARQEDERQVQRQEQVEELRRAHEDGSLNDRARVERAAEKMLGSE